MNTLTKLPPDYSDELLAKWFIAGALGRALAEIDPHHEWRDGRRPQTRGERHEARATAMLLKELRRIGATNLSYREPY